MEWYDYVRIICEIIGVIGALIPTIISVICLIKNIIQNKDWALVKKIAEEAMSTVEEYAKEHPEMTSEDKLNMAIEAVKAGLNVAGIDFDEELIKKIVDYIEEMCAFSKKINYCK